MASRAGKPNKATAQRERIIASEGQTPLAFLIATMRDEGQEFGVRLDAAKAAAPYVHPKLASNTHKHEGEVTLHSWLAQAK